MGHVHTYLLVGAIGKTKCIHYVNKELNVENWLSGYYRAEMTERSHLGAERARVTAGSDYPARPDGSGNKRRGWGPRSLEEGSCGAGAQTSGKGALPEARRG